MIGFGNPLLDGPDARYAELARIARAKQRCPATPRPSGDARRRARRRGAASSSARRAGQCRGHQAQAPLPETADELCAVARDLKADAERHPPRGPGHRERGQAAERERGAGPVPHGAFRHPRGARRRADKDPRAGPDPDAAREGQRRRTTATCRPPRSPPSSSTPTGSSCRPATRPPAARPTPRRSRAWRGPSSTPGRARCWSRTGRSTPNATVKLITTAVGEMARDRNVGRAEAMRRAMLALIDKGAAGGGAPGLLGAVRGGGRGRSGEVATSKLGHKRA